MRVGEETRSVSGFQDRPLIRLACGQPPSPLWGEGLGSVQMGRNLVLCGTFGYIYWELGRSAPVGRRAAQCAAPTAYPEVAPPFVGAGHWPARVLGDHKDRPYRRQKPAPSSAPFGGTFPPGGRFI